MQCRVWGGEGNNYGSGRNNALQKKRIALHIWHQLVDPPWSYSKVPNAWQTNMESHIFSASLRIWYHPTQILATTIKHITSQDLNPSHPHLCHHPVISCNADEPHLKLSNSNLILIKPTARHKGTVQVVDVIQFDPVVWCRWWRHWQLQLIDTLWRW